MKMFDPTIETVACGSSYRTMPTFGTWEEEVLRQSYPYVDYLSLHQYYTNHEGDVMNFLARSEEMGEFIQEVAAICEKIRLEVGSEKHIGLSFDEWNVWYHYAKNGRVPEKWTVARPVEEENYDFADALLVGSMLNTLLNHADVVKVACLAQLVNALAPIMTEPGGRCLGADDVLAVPLWLAVRPRHGPAAGGRGPDLCLRCQPEGPVPFQLRRALRGRHACDGLCREQKPRRSHDAGA